MIRFKLSLTRKLNNVDRYQHKNTLKVPVWFWLILVWMLLPWWLVIGSIILERNIYSYLYPDMLILILSIIFGMPILLITFFYMLKIRIRELMEFIAIIAWSGSLCNIILIVLEMVGREYECICSILVVIIDIMIFILLTFTPCLRNIAFIPD
ncbi:DUF2919 family protein [Citrobacter braakii]